MSLRRVAAYCLFAAMAGDLALSAPDLSLMEANRDGAKLKVKPACVGSERKTAAAFKQAAVDFNHPPRDYVTHRLHGWEVLVEKQLSEEAPELAAGMVARLEKKLGEIATLLPSGTLPDLRRLKVFLMHGPQAKAGGRSNGLEYFSANAPTHYNWLDARMASSVVMFNAANYAKLTEQWALKSLVHEFGHAHHLEHWPADRADIHNTWQAAMKAGLYQIVREEDKGTHNPNYTAQNHLEYFAELTATYFAGNSCFPRDRATLKTYDPAGYALIEKLWGISDDASGKPGQ